jgi:3-deoxy-D-manno-octulosonic-acid transferase
MNESAVRFKLVVAPHVVSETHDNELLEKFKDFNPVLFTRFNETYTEDSRVLILNTTGMLSHVYRYAGFSYIGGGFGVSIHNLLEPVTYGQPVIFGPKFDKFQEAHDLIKAGSGFTIKNKEEALQIFNKLLSDKELLAETSQISRDYVNANTGATNMVVSKIKEFITEPYGTGKL